MLIFSRRIGERIFVAPNIWIVLVEVRGFSARIGVEAPYEVRVKREEHVTNRDLNQGSVECRQEAVASRQQAESSRQEAS